MASYLIQGKGFWVKVLGKPHPGYTEGKPEDAPREWSFDLALNAGGLEQAKKLRIDSKVRNKGDDRGSFLSFKRREFKGDGTTANQPIKVVDHRGQPWDTSKLIGNGSTLNVRFNIYESRKGPKPIVLAIQVWDHVPYEGNAGGFPRKRETTVEKNEEDFSAEVAASE